MTTCSPRSSPDEEARGLHARLLTADPTAPSHLATTYLDRLIDWLIEYNPNIDLHYCITAAEDAILSLIKNPNTYKPERQTLEVYLRLSASGDLKNLLRSERRHNKHRIGLGAVEHSSEMGKYLRSEAANPEAILEQRQEQSASLPLIPAVVQAGLTQEEMKTLELMQEKERKTPVYAAILGISHLSFKKQKKEVKRIKDRLKKRLERSKE